MASAKLFVLLLIGTVLLCQVSGFLEEFLEDHERKYLTVNRFWASCGVDTPDTAK